MLNITIIGGTGFVGKELASYFQSRGYTIRCPAREVLGTLSGDLGVVIYVAGYGVCSSLSNKIDCVDANITKFISILKNCEFKRLVYFSSTRLYMASENSNELADLTFLTDDARRLFNLTKLVSEELCLSLDNAIVVRPSNIYGTALDSPLFLPSIARDAIKKSCVDMYVSPDYEKDYVSVDDVCMLIEQLVSKEYLENKIYNLAAGKNTSAQHIADIIQVETNAEVVWHNVRSDDFFPITNISNIVQEFDFKPRDVLNELKVMMNSFKCAHEEGLF
ncbi:hypothetical protein LCGC14_1516210 [marine sediment metagenome]|uniref:NAD-dependent epimerase/dehydratase domain-containing protein n=1 Tax=marine sediment metagenome TaxID=412755 RepID=A0A0F9J032_9ZZZZ